MQEERPILVTGMPRSGTTWVGRLISNTPEVRYVHEPFNISSETCACGIHFDKWFYYINSGNEVRFRRHFEHVLCTTVNKYELLNVVLKVRSSRNVRPLRAFIRQLRAKRTVVKDPLAVSSAAWMSSTFNMHVIILVRHPAGVVSSYKKLGWAHPFSHFQDQPQLMRDYLHPFADEIKEFASENHDIVDQAALLWKLIYYLVQEQSARHNDWMIIRYEDLAANAEIVFREIFQRLNLRFISQVQESIQETSSANPLSSTDPYSILRNSETMIWRWKSRLSDDEIVRVRMRVGDLADAFYSNEDW